MGDLEPRDEKQKSTSDLIAMIPEAFASLIEVANAYIANKELAIEKKHELDKKILEIKEKEIQSNERIEIEIERTRQKREKYLIISTIIISIISFSAITTIVMFTDEIGNGLMFILALVAIAPLSNERIKTIFSTNNRLKPN
jgi:K+-sensing histidine kinase KdpD